MLGDDVEAAGVDVPPMTPDTNVDVLEGAADAGGVEAAGDPKEKVDLAGAELEAAGVVDDPKENVGAVDDGVPLAAEVEVLAEAAAGAGAVGLAPPNPAKPPNGFALACGCALDVAGAPKLNVGVEVAGALPTRLAKGLLPADAVGAPNGEDVAAPNAIGLAAAVVPGVPPGVAFRFGSPRITLPAAGVLGIDPCDGESSSEASSPSSLRICFSACRFML